MATVTIKFQNSLNWYIWFTSTSYQCWLNLLKTQAIFIVLAVLVIKRVQRVLRKLQAKRAIIRTLAVAYCTLQKDKRSSVLNLPKQRQVCPSLYFQFNMRISVISGTLGVSCKRVVNVLSPLASNSCGGSYIILSLNTNHQPGWTALVLILKLAIFFWQQHIFFSYHREDITVSSKPPMPNLPISSCYFPLNNICKIIAIRSQANTTKILERGYREFRISIPINDLSNRFRQIQQTKTKASRFLKCIEVYV